MTPLQRKVMAVIGHSWRLPADIGIEVFPEDRNNLRVAEMRVQSTMAPLVKQGLVQKNRSGKYRLPPPMEARVNG